MPPRATWRGADIAINVAEEPNGLADLVKHSGPLDVIFEASGNAAALHAALELLRSRGLALQLGLGGEMPLPTNILVTREIELQRMSPAPRRSSPATSRRSRPLAPALARPNEGRARRGAGLGAQPLGELRRPRRKGFGEIVEHLRAVVRGRRAPAGRLRRRLDGIADVLAIAEAGQSDLAAFGVEDSELHPESGRACMPPI